MPLAFDDLCVAFHPRLDPHYLVVKEKPVHEKVFAAISFLQCFIRAATVRKRALYAAKPALALAQCVRVLPVRDVGSPLARSFTVAARI
jgi:hypothetical protein